MTYTQQPKAVSVSADRHVPAMIASTTRNYPAARHSTIESSARYRARHQVCSCGGSRHLMPQQLPQIVATPLLMATVRAMNSQATRPGNSLSWQLVVAAVTRKQTILRLCCHSASFIFLFYLVSDLELCGSYHVGRLLPSAHAHDFLGLCFSMRCGAAAGHSSRHIDAVPSGLFAPCWLDLPAGCR